MKTSHAANSRLFVNIFLRALQNIWRILNTIASCRHSIDTQCFPRASLSENCLRLERDNICGQMSVQIFEPNRGYMSRLSAISWWLQPECFLSVNSCYPFISTLPSYLLSYIFLISQQTGRWWRRRRRGSLKTDEKKKLAAIKTNSFIKCDNQRKDNVWFFFDETAVHLDSYFSVVKVSRTKRYTEFVDRFVTEVQKYDLGWLVVRSEFLESRRIK